jgi:hypothetical protein
MKTPIASLLLTVLAYTALTAGEGDDKTPTQQPTDQKATVAATAGMVYTTDQSRGPNGELPAEIVQALNSTINTSSDGLSEQHLADGAVMVDLQGRFQSALVMTVDDKGQLKSSCHSTAPGHTCEEHGKTEAAQPPPGN